MNIIVIILTIGSGLGLGQNKEHLIKIVLNMSCNGYDLDDSFMWDISDPNNSPEDFAAQIVNDFSLPPIF